MPAPRGPRGETVHVIARLSNKDELIIEVYAARGLRPTKHFSAQNRIEELEGMDIDFTVHSVKVV